MQTEKVIGFDFELSNAIQHGGSRDGRVHEAARYLLHELHGYPNRALHGTTIEFGRRFLDTCGSSWYIDSDHLEGNLPEHRSAFDFPVILHGAGFEAARRARVAAQNRLAPGTRLNVIANCSDGKTSWGSHVSMMLSRQCFRDLLTRRPHLAGFFASHLVTSSLYTGQGLVGPANDRPWCDFQLSQRADWFEEFSGQQTMFSRPLMNLREEHHAGAGLARLHIIYFDMVLNPIANILKIGTTQLVLSMIEAGWAEPLLQLDDPVEAASIVSRDLSLRQQLTMASRGRSLTALEVQQGIADLAGEFVAEGHAAEFVPRAEEIIDLWQETLQMLRERAVDALARRCDNWMKYLLLDRQRQRKNLTWQAAELKVLDSLFASIDRDESLFFRMADAGQVESMPSEEAILAALENPPEDTRAYLRAHVLRRFGDSVSNMNWDKIDFRVPSGRHWWSVATLHMPDPCRLGMHDSQFILEAESLLELVERASNQAAQSPSRLPLIAWN